MNYMKKSKIITIVFLALMSHAAYGQIDSISVVLNKKCDTITKKHFDKIVRKNLKKIKMKQEFSIDELIEVIKIDKSIPISKYDEAKGRYKEFIDLFNRKIVTIACDKLECTSLKGLILYSKKYGLYITMPMHKSDLSCYNYYSLK